MRFRFIFFDIFVSPPKTEHFQPLPSVSLVLTGKDSKWLLLNGPCMQTDENTQPLICEGFLFSLLSVY